MSHHLYLHVNPFISYFIYALIVCFYVELLLNWEYEFLLVTLLFNLEVLRSNYLTPFIFRLQPRF